jgi:hypothetical protein
MSTTKGVILGCVGASPLAAWKHRGTAALVDFTTTCELTSKPTLQRILARDVAKASRKRKSMSATSVRGRGGRVRGRGRGRGGRGARGGGALVREAIPTAHRLRRLNSRPDLDDDEDDGHEPDDFVQWSERDSNGNSSSDDELYDEKNALSYSEWRAAGHARRVREQKSDHGDAATEGANTRAYLRRRRTKRIVEDDDPPPSVSRAPSPDPCNLDSDDD